MWVTNSSITVGAGVSFGTLAKQQPGDVSKNEEEDPEYESDDVRGYDAKRKRVVGGDVTEKPPPPPFHLELYE